MTSIRKLESVQWTFTSRLTNMSDLNYWQRLKRLSLFSVERRRERYTIVHIWKVIQSLDPMIKDLDGNKLESIYNARRGRLLKVIPLKRVTPRLRTKLETSFMTRGPWLFNCLPQDVRAADFTLDTFKKKLDLALSHVPDRPVLPHYYQTS